MDKPDDIPEDVWQAANYAVAHAPDYTERLHEDVARAIMAERERAIAACEAQKVIFSSTDYAVPQPLGSLMERFACDQCIEAIRAGGA